MKARKSVTRTFVEKLRSPLLPWSRGLKGLGTGFFLLLATPSIHAADGAPATNPPTPPPSQPIIWTARIDGTIDPATSNYLAMAIQRAEREQAQLLLVELDTPGGLVSSVREMTQAIDRSSVPVVVYVTPAGASATSAGALLMLASHYGGMAPGTNLGAAHPVGSNGEEIKGAMGEKALNDTIAFARSLAEVRGRNRDLAEAVVSKSRSFTAEEAVSNRLIDALSASREDLLKKINGRSLRIGSREVVVRTENAVIRSAEMTLGQRLLHYLANPNIAALLMTLGVLLIYVEVSNPGITIAGILGGISILISFMAFQTLPIRVGGLGLLLLGIAMMIVEPFVAASGAVAAGGILSFILGLIWIMDPAASDLSISTVVWVGSAVTLTFFVALISYAASRTRALSRRTLNRIGGGQFSGLSGYIGHVESTAEEGRRGRAVFRGETWEFRSRTPVRTGDAVVVEKVEGMIAHVRPQSPGSRADS